jgi:benzodiazapine receptor
VMYNRFMLKNKLLSFLLFAIITYSASAIGSLATINFKEPWYSMLVMPTYNPPDWVFAPVWTTLYLFMTIAIWKFWHSKNRDIVTIYIYLIHLIINTTWSIVFFVFHKIFLALLVLIILISLIVLLMQRFKKITLVSYYLMIPYLLWCLYALSLNLSLFIFN